ncbi:hypothetical protein GCM10029992_65920 [Glycomyces albus]
MVLHAAADLAKVRGLGAADGDDEVRAREQVQLADLDLLGRVEVAGRAQDAEQGLAVAFELGALVAGQGVLDRERVEVERCCHGLDGGVVGPVEADPPHAAAGADQFVGALQGPGLDPAPVDVDGGLHYGLGAAAVSRPARFLLVPRPFGRRSDSRLRKGFRSNLAIAAPPFLALAATVARRRRVGDGKRMQTDGAAP